VVVEFDPDTELAKLMGVLNAEREQAIQAGSTMAALLANFRGQLIAGGFTTETAEGLCADYFNAMLDAQG
jgi:hypothetical protein